MLEAVVGLAAVSSAERAGSAVAADAAWLERTPSWAACSGSVAALGGRKKAAVHVSAAVVPDVVPPHCPHTSAAAADVDVRSCADVGDELARHSKLLQIQPGGRQAPAMVMERLATDKQSAAMTAAAGPRPVDGMGGS